MKKRIWIACLLSLLLVAALASTAPANAESAAATVRNNDDASVRYSEADEALTESAYDRFGGILWICVGALLPVATFIITRFSDSKAR